MVRRLGPITSTAAFWDYTDSASRIIAFLIVAVSGGFSFLACAVLGGL